MLRDMTESFAKAVAKDKNVILDNYMLSEGLYIRLNADKPISQIDYKDCVVIDNKDIPIDKIELYKWFKERDYCSSILSTNKAIDTDGRKIHSSNHLSYFVKKGTLPGLSDKAITADKLIELTQKYYEKLHNSEEYFKKLFPVSKKLKRSEKEEAEERFLIKYYKEEIDYIRSSKRKNDIKKYKDYVISNLSEIIKCIKVLSEELKIKNYIKLFFEADIETYRMEKRVYVTPRIYNIQDYNVFYNEEILGLPVCDITTNNKKPYLLLKTMKCTVPSRDTTEKVELTKNFYSWLKKKSKEAYDGTKLEYDYEFNSGNSYNNDGPFYLIHTDRSNQIDDFDNIPIHVNNINFELKNIMKVNKWDEKKEQYLTEKYQEDIRIKTLPSLQVFVSKYYFSGQMKGYFKTYEPDISPNKFTNGMKVLYMNSRQAFFDYFHKGIDTGINQIIDRITLESIEEQIKHTVEGRKLNKMKQAYNLRLALLEYFKIEGGSQMASKIKSAIENLNQKLSSKEIVYCESDEEFYFTAGQLAYYILSQSERSNKTFGLFEPFLTAKNSQQVKRKLADVFEVYKHAISINNTRFKNAMAMVMDYETERRIKDQMKDMLIAGILSSNMFYEKENKEVAENEK